MRPRPEPRVAAFLDSIADEAIRLACVTMWEILDGIGRPPMNRHERLLQAILRGRSDANIRFSNLRALMEYLGFEEHIRGSHHLFDKECVVEIVNLQSRGGHAKPYQVRQVRRLILKYKLGGDD